MERILEFKWTVSRGRDTYGYNICTLHVDGRKAAQCNGGGYDMEGTCLGDWIAHTFKDELVKLSIPINQRNGKDVQEYYGLSFHDPTFDPGKVIPEEPPIFAGEKDKGKTIAQMEKEGTSIGLERYQAFYSASSSVPTQRHTIPLIDGGCGFDSVRKIVKALGYELEYLRPLSTKNRSVYNLRKQGR